MLPLCGSSVSCVVLMSANGRVVRIEEWEAGVSERGR